MITTSDANTSTEASSKSTSLHSHLYYFGRGDSCRRPLGIRHDPMHNLKEFGVVGFPSTFREARTVL
jgi:hypothetical protein